MLNNFKPVPVNDRYSLVMFFFQAQIEFESRLALEESQAKPPRVLPRRDSAYLTELANSAVRIKQGQKFYNPTECQLNKIFKGELYGYC